jgi:hypothetical protein
MVVCKSSAFAVGVGAVVVVVVVVDDKVLVVVVVYRRLIVESWFSFTLLEDYWCRSLCRWCKFQIAINLGDSCKSG